MNLDNEHDALFEQLLTINQTTFEGQWYETAYHALAAAFHRAQDLGAVSLMAQVQQLATQQMNTIDTSAPEHTLSSQSAHTRGHQSIYGLLAQQAATRIRISNAEQGTSGC